MLPRRYVLAGLLLVVSSGALSFAPTWREKTTPLPERISDADYWQLIDTLSEDGGYFRSDNFISNELTFQHVIPELKQRTPANGVYLGVGPDQNFTYVVALQPKIAFIVDIRRQNMLLHLLHKALIERSTDRAAFLSRLFSRPRPEGLGPESSVQTLFEAYAQVPSSEDAFQQNLAGAIDWLVTHHGFRLSGADLRSIEYVYRAFYNGGPDLRYSFTNQFSNRWFPSYADLMQETDGQGQPRGYLATEEHFRVLKDLEQRNVLIPVVGNFAGPKAIRAVGRYLRSHGATVTAFYTSNVEFYLFQNDGWKRFFNNVATLPLDERSTFIRSYTNNIGLGRSPGARSTTLLDPMADLIRDFHEGHVQTYYDLVERSR
jgi:hypothetical protein